MAGNIGGGSQCDVCGGIVALDDPEEMWIMDGSCHATCRVCGAKYNALNVRPPFSDLQYRSSLRNEPHPDDFPTVEPWKSQIEKMYGPLIKQPIEPAAAGAIKETKDMGQKDLAGPKENEP